ncbi:MAG: ECF transporter S component [Tuberibacillus sp.]
MGRSKWSLLVIVSFIVLLLVLFRAHLTRHPYLFSILLLLITFVPFIFRFERRKLEGREIVLLAVLSALAAVSRVPFASIPSVQPSTFVVIMSGLVFGSESGFVIGATTALVSNLFLGQGPWTPWQMLAWGAIGLLAGILKKVPWLSSKPGLIIFGVFSGYFFGFVMNMWVILNMIQSLNLKEAVALYGASLYFDTAHAITNAILLAFFSRGWMKVLLRFKKKYGLLEE